MAVFKCKMCGGALEINGNETVAVCEYCGTKQTLPKLTDDRKANLYDRANHFRRNNEFDKAMLIYESILNEDKTDAESYWSLVLCRYGIEYVEDPASHKRIPTVNRAQYTSIFMDEDYKSAIEYADGFQKDVYEAEANAIDEIQKGILEISQKEEPFDVFICYKETDANGRRTPDSVLATELYHELCKEGFKVFFSRITLEDKLGTAYEPYIFAALNSAKVMVVLGTKQEYFNAVWVKNEWSRYLALIKNGARKTLIPAYKDMDPYDLPEEFSHLQAQDMTKLGFMKDLVRGIRKIAGEEEKPAVIKETVVTSASASTNTAPLLERAFMFLEDGNWQSADEYCEKVLDIEPKNAQAYLGKLMSEFKVKKQEALKNCALPFDNSANYQKAIRFGDNKLISFLDSANEFIKERINEKRKADAKAEKERKLAEEKARIEAEKEEKHKKAIRLKETDIIDNIKSARTIFLDLEDYKDSKEQSESCLQMIYEKSVKYLNGSDSEMWPFAIKAFEYLADYKDSKAKKADVEAKVKAYEEKKKALIKKSLTIGIPALIGLIVIIVIISAISNSVKYKNALELAESGNNVQAAMIFGELGDYKDAKAKSFEYWNEIALRETVSSGRLHTIGLKTDGTVVAVGDNDYGQCNVSNWSDIIAVSAGDSRSVGLKSDGTVVAVGSNSYGECNVSAWENIVAISTWRSHTVGLKTDGTVMAVGDNDHGQCNVEDWSDIIAISAGWNHTVGLKSDGTVVAVGNNGDGSCNVENWSDIVAISAGEYYTVGLKSDGTVVAVGENSCGQCDVNNWSDIVVISAGDEHTIGLKSDGTIVTVGSGNDGEKHVDDWSDIVAVSSGWHHSTGLKSDGTVVVACYRQYSSTEVDNWRDIKLPQKLTIDPSLVNAVKEEKEKAYNEALALVEAGKYQDAIAAFEKIGNYKDAKEYITKINENYLTTKEPETIINKSDNLTVTKIVQQIKETTEKAVSKKKAVKNCTVSAGDFHTVGVKTNGTVIAVGDNYWGQNNVSGWTDIIFVSANNTHTVGLKSNGTVVAVGSNSDGQCDVSGWKDIVTVTTGYNHTVGVKSDGMVVAVGDNGDGQCNISKWTNIIAVAAGDYHTVGLKSDGTVVAVGDNDNGQCNVENWSDIIAIAAAEDHTIGLKSNGTVVAVGKNRSGQCDVSGWTDIIAISTGYGHTVGLKSNGTVVAVGDNENGQCNVSGWKDIITISAGSAHTVGLKSNGTVVATKYIDNSPSDDIDDYDGQCDVSGWKNIKVN